MCHVSCRAGGTRDVFWSGISLVMGKLGADGAVKTGICWVSGSASALALSATERLPATHDERHGGHSGPKPGVNPAVSCQQSGTGLLTGKSHNRRYARGEKPAMLRASRLYGQLKTMRCVDWRESAGRIFSAVSGTGLATGKSHIKDTLAAMEALPTR